MNKLMIASSPLKNQLYTDETIISLQLTKSNEYKLMIASLPLKNKLYTNEKTS